MAPKSPEDKKKQFVILVGNMELVGCDHCGSQIYVTNISVPLSQNKEGDNVLSRIFFFLSLLTTHGILVPRPGIEPVPPAVDVQSPNH